MTASESGISRSVARGAGLTISKRTPLAVWRSEASFLNHEGFRTFSGDRSYRLRNKRQPSRRRRDHPTYDDGERRRDKAFREAWPILARQRELQPNDDGVMDEINRVSVGAEAIRKRRLSAREANEDREQCEA
jgi:hypothetical protein